MSYSSKCSLPVKLGVGTRRSATLSSSIKYHTHFLMFNNFKHQFSATSDNTLVLGFSRSKLEFISFRLSKLIRHMFVFSTLMTLQPVVTT